MDAQTILNVAVVVGGLYFVGRVAFKKISGSLAARREAQLASAQAMNRLAEELSKINAQVGEGMVSPLLQGLVRVCEAQVEEIGRLRASVDKFVKVVTPEAGRDEDVVEGYDEVMADRTFAKQQFMSQGYTEDEAEAQVDAEQVKKTLSPSVVTY